jgi:O-antigen/teichoic acid export membrane protein
MAMPFAWAGIFSRLYGYLDTFLLKTLVGDAALGYYSLPYKITFVWQFIPLALVASLYPAFTAYYQTDKDKLAKLFNKTFIYLLVIAVPLSLGLSLMSGSIFLHIYGTEYLPSAAALQVLVFTLPFLFLNFPIGYLLNACDKQVRNTINIGIAMLISLIGNLIIIPRFSFVGASYVSVFTTAVLFILGFIVATRVVKINWKNLGINILKLIVCSAGLIAAILLTANNIHYLISIVISGLVYIVLVLVTKLVSWAEVVGLIKAFKNSE